MARLSQLLERRERLIAINNNLANQYFRDDAKIKAKKNKVQELLSKLNGERYAVEAAQYKAHQQTPEHAALMATKGASGFQILLHSRP